jgi:polysaccharide export outer membrane protein
MVVDLGRVMNGAALPMPLQDGDIVYVPKTGLGGWNEIVSELLPTFQLFNALASPFLWAEALDDDN